MKSPMQPSHALVAVFFVAFVALRAPYLSLPLERDEGEYAYIAQRMIEGEIPYLDAFDQKPPAVFVVYRVAFGLFGQSIEAIHAMLYLWSAATALALFALVSRWGGRGAGLWAAGLFVALGNHPVLFATAANTEIFMLLPLIASVWWMEKATCEGRLGSWAASGAALALACWFKPVAAAQILLLGAWAMWMPGASARPTLRERARALAAIAAGGIAMSLPILLILAWKGALGAMIDAVFLHNFAYSTRLSLARGAENLLLRLDRQTAAFGAAWLLAAAALLWRGASGTLGSSLRVRVLLAAWLGVSALGASAGLYFREHYFIQWLPALCAAAALPLATFCDAARRRGTVAGWVATMASAAWVLVPPTLAQAHLLRADSVGERAWRIYGANPFAESVPIADYIREHSAPHDRVYVIGSEPQILFYARRRSATRYIFVYPLNIIGPGVLARQQEAWQELRDVRPEYVVDVRLQASHLVQRGAPGLLYERSRRMLEREYELEWVSYRERGRPLYRRLTGAAAVGWLERARRDGSAERAHALLVYRRASPVRSPAATER